MIAGDANVAKAGAAAKRPRWLTDPFLDSARSSSANQGRETALSVPQRGGYGLRVTFPLNSILAEELPTRIPKSPGVAVQPFLAMS